MSWTEKGSHSPSRSGGVNCDPDDLRKLADMLEAALDKLKHGETKHLNDECIGCVWRPKTGDPFPEMCGNCSRFYGDYYTTTKDEE